MEKKNENKMYKVIKGGTGKEYFASIEPQIEEVTLKLLEIVDAVDDGNVRMFALVKAVSTSIAYLTQGKKEGKKEMFELFNSEVNRMLQVYEKMETDFTLTNNKA